MIKSAFLLIFILFIQCGYAEADPNDDEMIIRPACNQYCDKINAIKIIFVNKSDFKLDSEKSLFIEKFEAKIKEKKLNEKISVSSIDSANRYTWMPYIFTAIRVEVYFDEGLKKSDDIRIGIKMVTPSGAYYDEFLCKINSNCISEKFDDFFEIIVSDFVFDQSILNKSTKI